MKIILTLEVPDGTTVADISAVPTDAPGPRSAPKAPEVVQETSPPWENTWAGLADTTEPVTEEFPPIGSQQPKCPVHHSSHLVPAGTIKSGPRAGQGYPAFWGCDDRDCHAGKNGKSWRADYRAVA